MASVQKYRSFRTDKVMVGTLRPSGGSLVSLMQFCSTDIGSPFSNAGGGSADKNSLHAGSTHKWLVAVHAAFGWYTSSAKIIKQCSGLRAHDFNGNCFGLSLEGPSLRQAYTIIFLVGSCSVELHTS